MSHVSPVRYDFRDDILQETVTSPAAAHVWVLPHIILFFSVLCCMNAKRKLISNNCTTKWLLFCLGHVVLHTCQVLCGVNPPPPPPQPWAPCSEARCTMKGHWGPIKGPIEIQPRAGQRATVWTVEIWHPLTEAACSPLRAMLRASLAGELSFTCSDSVPADPGLHRQLARQTQRCLQSGREWPEKTNTRLHYLKSYNVLSGVLER